MAPSLRLGLRTAVGWIAAYAFVLQATLAGALHPAAGDPSQAFDPLSIICVIDGGKAHGGLPDQTPNSGGHGAHLDNHCGLCAVSVPAIAPASQATIDSLSPARSVLAAVATDSVTTHDLGALPGRPRAPPTTV